MAQSPLSKIKFDYIKSNFFRSVRTDGAWAGTNGFSDVVLSFYSERTPIPKQTVHQLLEQHKIGDEIKAERITRDAVVREVEVCMSMSLEVAESLRDLLEKHIQTLQQLKTKSTGRKK